MTERRMNGFNAYENAWDVMAKRLWSVLGYNLAWFVGSAGVIVLILLLTVLPFRSWGAFFVIAFFVFLVLFVISLVMHLVRGRKA